HRRLKGEAGFAEEHLSMRQRQRVSPFLRSQTLVVNLDDAAHRLLLKPLARIAFMHSRSPGKISRTLGADLRKRPIDAQPVAHIDAHRLDAPHDIAHQPLYELIALRCGLDQTAETCSSSATRNDDPHPQAATTFGLSTLKPAP